MTHLNNVSQSNIDYDQTLVLPAGCATSLSAATGPPPCWLASYVTVALRGLASIAE